MKLNKYIDHTLLKPDATTEQIKKICDEAKKYDFASVCVNSCHAELVARELKDSGVSTCCVVGFPLGAMLTEAKAYEARLAIEKGANEIDMVINIGAAKEGNWKLVEDDIKAVVDACHPRALLKVIIETCLLTDEEKREACRCAVSRLCQDQHRLFHRGRKRTRRCAHARDCRPGCRRKGLWRRAHPRGR